MPSTPSKTIVFFDGVCNLCNSSVNLLLKLDKKEVFSFSSLQSDFASNLIPKEIQTEKDSMVLFKNERFYTEAEAVFEMVKTLNNWTKLLLVLKILPLKWNTIIYGWVAKNRYKMFGRKDECMIPDENVRNRFIS
jgi:predicted DCC family thiol-disulfide oxidoreductase YuxK